MKMSSVKLNEVQVDEVCSLAKEERLSLGFAGKTTIANDIHTILDKLNIILLELPIESKTDKIAFSAAIMHMEENSDKLTFIGVNTSDYYDNQVYSIAHELYHFYTKSGSHISRLKDEIIDINEVKANLFAAEFLLPKSILKSIILNQFKKSNLEKIQNKKLLRFIVRLHCTWWLPYSIILKRLNEIGAITKGQYNELNKVNVRDPKEEYYKLGQAFNREVFQKLNQVTNTIGTSPEEIEIIIRNFEDSLIDESEFANILALFNKRPDEFGFEAEISQDDLDQFEDFFSKDGDDESRPHTS